MNRLIASLCCLVVVFTGQLEAAAPIQFEPVPDFVKLPDHITLDACSGVAVNSQGNVYLFHRGKHPIICLDREGNFLRSFGDDYIETAHGLRIDKDDNVWVTDVGNHQVLKFSPSGELLLSLGKAGTAGDGVDEFNKPTDIAFGPRGEIYVTDGYGNSRVMKFTANGGFLAAWGEAGDQPGQFNTPHAVSLDRDGRLLIGDRENDRVQIYTPQGKLVDVWPGFAPFGLAHDAEGNLFAADGRANKVLQIGADGKVIHAWGGEGSAPGQFQLPHMIATDSKGNLYVVEITGKRLQKLARK
jgi:DNA-binding beta-propeller fold protein YncE